MKTSRFNGADYKHDRDSARLTNQYFDIFNLMIDGEYRTLGQIAARTHHPEPSVSAQLRHMRKPRFGSHEVNRRYTGKGLYEYQLIVNTEQLSLFDEDRMDIIGQNGPTGEHYEQTTKD